MRRKDNQNRFSLSWKDTEKVNTYKSIVKPLFLIADSMHVAVQVQKKNISNEVQS